jgi:mRNA interferase RelE/StbE
MAYRIEFTAAAKRQFDKLPADIQRRLAEAVDRIGENPRHTGTVKLSGDEGLYRARAGDYRIVYRIEDNRLLVLVVKIGHRREVYRG